MHSQHDAPFFSLFNVPGRRFDEAALLRLGAAMRLPRNSMANSNVPSGYVYFGQFLAHDLTRLKEADDLPLAQPRAFDALTQLRTPLLDLDSVYGSGYDDAAVPLNQGKFLLGAAIDFANLPVPDSDLPRNPRTLAPLVPDDRNDDNLVVAQLHVQFLKLHNWFHDRFRARNWRLKPRELYALAREQVLLHYQEVVLHDFLPRLLDQVVWQHIVRDDAPGLWSPRSGADCRAGMPVEFAGAALRFGHAMLLPRYNINATMELNLQELFTMTGEGGFDRAPALPAANVVDWRFFFDFSGYPGVAREPRMNKALAINDEVTIAVPRLRRDHGQPFDALATRNLLRASQLQLPSGQDIAQSLLAAPHARALCAAIGFDQHYADTTAAALQPHTNACIQAAGADFGTHTPLWYYLLLEAWTHSRGLRLGKVGSLIVADTIRGLARLGAHDNTPRQPWISPTGPNGKLRISDLLYPVMQAPMQHPMQNRQ
jgi:hypothetical protein